MIDLQVRFAMIPVIALAQSEAMKTAALATSARVRRRPSGVKPSGVFLGILF
jgi:hypothetical protein